MVLGKHLQVYAALHVRHAVAKAKASKLEVLHCYNLHQAMADEYKYIFTIQTDVHLTHTQTSSPQHFLLTVIWVWFFEKPGRHTKVFR